jgi:hypothetical protein
MPVALKLGDMTVAVEEPALALDIRLGPRPYLHPVRTLAGTIVTDALCEDHPWHLGASLSMQDVDGTNFWGGRTYVRGSGYVWREDHGRIVASPDGSRLWQNAAGQTLITERRELTAHLIPGGWQMILRYALSTPLPSGVSLGSPATNGRPGGAGYGGFFWRCAPVPGQRADRRHPALTWTSSRVGEHAVNGSAEPWVAVQVGQAYTLVFEGLRDADRWFVRTGDYAGVCAALAFHRPLLLRHGTTLNRELTIRVLDGPAGPSRPAV